MVVMEEISFRFVRRIHVRREIEEEEKKRVRNGKRGVSR